MTNPYHPIFWNINREAVPQQAVELRMSVEQAQALHDELTMVATRREVCSLLRGVLDSALERARVPRYLDKPPAVGSRVQFQKQAGTVVEAPQGSAAEQKPDRFVSVQFDCMPEPVFCFFNRLERA